MNLKYLSDNVLEAVCGGSGKDVITKTGLAPSEDALYTTGIVQDLTEVPANEASYGVASNTGDGNGRFNLSPWNPKTNTFF